MRAEICFLIGSTLCQWMLPEHITRREIEGKKAIGWRPINTAEMPNFYASAATLP
jgi:hypothetical protein